MCDQLVTLVEKTDNFKQQDKTAIYKGLDPAEVEQLLVRRLKYKGLPKIHCYRGPTSTLINQSTNIIDEFPVYKQWSVQGQKQLKCDRLGI